MLKVKQSRASIEFEYEFKDGTKEIFTYRAPTTLQVREALEIDGDNLKELLDFTCKAVKECLVGKRVDELLKEQEEANIFTFKALLDDSLGKQKTQR